MEFSKIHTIKKIGTLPTIDIEINNGHHLYYANNIITSNSHAVSYSYIAYWTAYLKTHYPMEFYIEYLNNSKDKPKPKKEIKELITDARYHNINTRICSINDLIEDKVTKFYSKNGEILFGLEHVKGIGKAHIKSLSKILDKNITWIQVLESNLQKQVILNLISVGCFDAFKISRKKMIYDYTIYNKLSQREMELSKDIHDLRSKLEFLLDKVNINRENIIDSLIKALDHPSYSLDDDMDWIYRIETELMGICLKYHKTDISKFIPDSTCKQINDGKQGECTLLLEITEPKEYKIKNGKSKGDPMGSFSASDATGEIKCMMFSEAWVENKHKLYEDAIIFVSGYPSKRGGFIINKVK